MKPNQAGKSIYQLGHRRLGKAIGYYLASGGLCAAFVVIFPVFLFSAIGLILYLGLGGAAYLLYIQGAILNKSTQWPYQGVAAEMEVGNLMEQLELEGWEISYNVPAKQEWRYRFLPAIASVLSLIT